MRLGIIGLPNSGKTTIFNALTGQKLETGAVTTGQLQVDADTAESNPSQWLLDLSRPFDDAGS